MLFKKTAGIGVFGGSGFYSFLKGTKSIEVDTPYGPPSDKIVIGEVHGRPVAFMPRHGRNHDLPPHMINYRANIYAMKQLGVKYIFGPCASGSLQPGIKPGDLVICDQFVDRTWGRKDTFYDGPKTVHISMAEPYCPVLRKTVIESAAELKIDVHPEGTVVVIQGPRFSTAAESRWFSGQGWEVVNMTQYPENYLAREMEICYVNISIITDYDAGLEGRPDIKPVTLEEVVRVFKKNNEKIRELLFRAIEKIPGKRSCICSRALKDAIIS
ncbi:MAG: S-methyl-5'-thioadenosine phosphorylase [Actinobacteria bacterium]|nr:S-methyl-5'-thioadenosine phosphorylase [Actinomycetota bacterium]